MNRARLRWFNLIDVASYDRTTPEYLTKFVQSEIAKWAIPIRAGGISVD